MASNMFQFRVVIHNEEDEAVKDYFATLDEIFQAIVGLSAWGFDTPHTESEIHTV